MKQLSHVIIFTILLMILFSCNSNSEKETNPNSQKGEQLDSSNKEEIDSTEFYAYFIKDSSDLHEHELSGNVKFVQKTVYHDLGNTIFKLYFDSSGTIYKEWSSMNSTSRFRPADSMIFEYYDYGLVFKRTSYYPHVGDYRDGDLCCYEEHFYNLKDSTEKIKYFGSSGGMISEDWLKYGSSGELLWLEEGGINRNEFHFYFEYNEQMLVSEIIEVDGLFGDTIDITAIDYKFDPQGNWIKKTSRSTWSNRTDIRIEKRKIEYY